eukprot:jgi/Tetstr1/446081/TSEL_033682.t1
MEASPAAASSSSSPSRRSPPLSAVWRKMRDGRLFRAGLRRSDDGSPRDHLTPAATAPAAMDAGPVRAEEGQATLQRPSQLKVAADRIIAQNKLLREMRSIPGASPGIDTKRSRYDELAQRFHAPCSVTAVEYNVEGVVVERELDRKGLLTFINAPRKEEDGTVRWMNVDGLNWGILSQLAAEYDLHPLALEDMLHVPQRPKADFYEGCMYMCLLTLCLRKHDAGGSQPASAEAEDEYTALWGRFLNGEVAVQQCSMFLLEGHTLLTVFLRDSRSVTGPIVAELQRQGTLLRESEDASFLMYRVIDVIVDHLGPISDEYNDVLDEYERQVVCGKPTARSTSVIYAQQRELTQMSRMISPCHSLISNIVSRDAQNDSMLTRLTAVYLNDTIDHTDAASEVLLGLADECRDLISLIFNLTAHRQSMATQTLAVVSVIFLPITFIAGVYGTNFENTPEYKWEYGYPYFWALLIGVTIIFSLALYKVGLFKQYD